MKTKVFYKVFLIVILLFILIIMNSNISRASQVKAPVVSPGSSSGTSSGTLPDNVLDDVNAWVPSSISTSDVQPALNKVGIVLGTVRNISIVVAVISLMVIGLKYIFGSVEERADYKKSLMPYLIGVLMAAVGTTLVTFIFNVVY